MDAVQIENNCSSCSFQQFRMVVDGSMLDGPFCCFGTFYMDTRPVKIAEMSKCPMPFRHSHSDNQMKIGDINDNLKSDNKGYFERH